MQLRPYQSEAVEAVYNHLRTRDDNPCVVIPTAGGKTLVLGRIATDAVSRWNGRVLVLAHVRELLEQNAAKIAALCPGIDVGVYSAGLNRRDTERPVIVAGIQSVYKRAPELGRFDLAIVDEAHLIPPDGEGMYRQFFAEAKVVNPNLRIIGLTATPYRMKGGMICQPENVLNHVCYEIGVKELIAQGYLCPLKSKAGRRKPDTSALHIRAGEFVASEVESLMDSDSLVRSACHEILEQTADRNHCLIFAAGVQHAEHIAAALHALGHECGVVTAETPSATRAALLGRFKGEDVSMPGADLFEAPRTGPLKYLVNVGVLTTGFDAPNIDCVALLRPTNSPGLYYQMVGRGFRLHSGKTDCLVLDFGGNILRHGPVDALRVDDSAPAAGEAPAKECPKCFALIHAGYGTCPECGYEFPPPEREQHDASAATEGILTGQVTETDHDVRSVRYQPWEKYDRKTDKLISRTLRVDYHCPNGLLGTFIKVHSEWVCPEHEGYARQKFEQWWQSRSNEPIPSTVDDALELAEAGALAEPTQITVRSVTGEKFDRIVDYRLPPKPPRLDGADEREPALVGEPNPYCVPEDEIPF